MEEFDFSQYCDPIKSNNKLLTKNYSLSYDSKMRKGMNANTVVIGMDYDVVRGYIKPNIENTDSSFVVVDVKKELYDKHSSELLKRGYSVKLLNFVDFSGSDGFNLFKYIEPEDPKRDIMMAVDNLYGIYKDAVDPFFMNSAKCVVCAAMFYEYKTDKSFSEALKIIDKVCSIRDDGSTDADALFGNLGKVDPSDIAYRYWREFSCLTSKCKKDIVAILKVFRNRYSKGYGDRGISMFTKDTLDIVSIGEKKTAVFLEISEIDSSMYYLVRLFYKLLFDSLCRKADEYPDGLPVHVEVFMREFSLIHPDGFNMMVSDLRSRNISVSIVLQSLKQLRSTEDWGAISDIIDTILYFGCRDKETCNYLASLVGESHLDDITHIKNDDAFLVITKSPSVNLIKDSRLGLL